MRGQDGDAGEVLREGDGRLPSPNRDALVGALGEVASGLLAAATFPMAVMDVEFRLVAVNPALQARASLGDGWYGRTVPEIAGRRLWARIEPYYLRAAAGEEVFATDILIGRPGPNASFMDLHLVPIRIDGAVCGLAASYSDEPMRQRAERRLQQRTELYRLLARTARAATTSTTAQELYEEACRLVVETTGLACAWVGVVDGTEVRLVAHSGDDGGYFEHVSVSVDPDDPRSTGPTGLAIRDGRPMVLNDFLNAPGTKPWKPAAARAGLQASAAIPFKERGTVVGALSVYANEPDFFTDDLVETLGELGPTMALALDRFAEAHDRAVQEEQAKALEDQLRHAAKMEAIGTLAGGVAHDFNNTLTVIRNTVRLVLDAPGTDPSVRERLEQIDLAAESAAGLTAQLLTFGRRQVRSPAVLRIDDEIRASMGMIERLLRESIVIDVALSAPEATVQIDRTELQQAVLNLAANARDAMPNGGTLKVSTRVVEVDDRRAAGRLMLEPGRYAVLEVDDDGIGMDAETVDRMFDPFYTTKELGTGLGLATVFGIVRGSGGDVWAYSEPGLGTTLRLYFPLAAAQALAPVAPTNEESAPSRGSETVLVVEDSEMLRPLVATILRSAGYEVLTASDGIEALEIAANHPSPIELVLTDVVMPRMSGGELAGEMERRYPGIRVLFTSGYPADTVVRHGIAEARVAFVQKPYVGNELLVQVRSILDRPTAP